MKFDFAIGNPPYQDETLGDNKGFAPPVYNLFLEEAYKVADKVEMIHPARFLFNAGSTPKAWNEKMLNDEHLKVVWHEKDSSKIFPNTEIKGGLAITYHDQRKKFGSIGIFTTYEELNKILEKIRKGKRFVPLSSVAVSGYAYHFSEVLHAEHPEAIKALSKGHAFDLKSNVFDTIPECFSDEKPVDKFEYIRILGRENSERKYKYIRRDYTNHVCNLDKFKVFMSKADGAAGQIGRPIPARIVGKVEIASPEVGFTESFISIGSFDTEDEARAAMKYIKGRFSRTLLGVLKTTQDITPGKWKYVPLQDFTPNSDIDWSQSVAGIDQQLYKKYGLSAEEIQFIETHVKEMV